MDGLANVQANSLFSATPQSYFEISFTVAGSQYCIAFAMLQLLQEVIRLIVVVHFRSVIH